MSEDSQPRGRKLLLIATGEYTSDQWESLDVDAETTVWRDWLTNPELRDRRFEAIFEDLARSPTPERLEEVMRLEDSLDQDDAVVCYITGHGEVQDDEHWLVLTGSRPDDPESGLDTRRLLRWLRRRVRNALIIVDTCHAGEIGRYLASLDRDLAQGWILVASASAYRQARLGALTAAIDRFSRTGADDDTQPYLSYWELMRSLANSLKDQKWREFGTKPDNAHERMVFFPNRHYRPEARDQVPLEPARQDMAVLSTDLAAHWGPRARGVSDTSVSGMYFTGRDALMSKLIQAAQDGEPRTWAVTGAAGCGKSTVLSRLVTLSDPSFRAKYPEAAMAGLGHPIPRVQDVDIAILAKGKVAVTVLDQIRGALGIPADADGTLRNTIDRIHGSRTGLPPVTVVLDALDEAEDPEGIVNHVLSPLTRGVETRWMRLLVGVRGSAAHDIADESLASRMIRSLGAEIIAADQDPFWIQGDLADHISLLLRAGRSEGQSPYTDLPVDQVRRLADAIAEISGTSYVHARLIADGLGARDAVQDPTDEAWRLAASGELAQVFEAELNAEFPADIDRQRVRTLFRAAAVARGNGVPRRTIWPALAGALDPGGRDYRDEEIAWLLAQRIGGYLTRDSEDDVTVYRPFHDALRQALTVDFRPADYVKITTTLRAAFEIVRVGELVIPPQPYLQRHLVEHAAESRELDELLEQSGVLLWANPDHLFPLLDSLTTRTGQLTKSMYRRTIHQFRGREPRERAGPLQLAARESGLNGLADDITAVAPDRSWDIRWTATRSVNEHHVIAGHDDDVTAVAVGALSDGTPVVVSGSKDKTVRVWRLADGRPIGEPLLGHEHDVTAVAVGALSDGTPVVVSSDNRTVRVWRLGDGLAVGNPIVHDGGSSSVAVSAMPDGTPVILAGSHRTIQVLRLVDVQPVGEPIRSGDYGGELVAAGMLPDGTQIVVSGGSATDTLGVWRVEDGQRIGYVSAHDTGALALAIGRLSDGEPVVISCTGIRREVQVSTLPEGGSIQHRMQHDDYVRSVAVGALPDGTPVAISGGDDRTVRIWRLADGQPIGEPIRGHDHWVMALAAGVLPDGTPVVVSGSRDRTVRVWRLAASQPATNQSGRHSDWVESVATGALPDGTPVVLSGSRDRTARMWRLRDGQPIGEPIVHPNWVRSITVGALPDGIPVAISGTHAGTTDPGRMYDPDHTAGALRLWRLADAQPVGEPLHGHSGTVATLAVGSLADETPVIVSGSDDRTVRVWRLSQSRADPVSSPQGEAQPKRSLQRLVPLLHSRRRWLTRDNLPKPVLHDGEVTSIALGELPDGTPVVVSGSDDCTVRVWRVTDGHQHGRTLVGHHRAVAAVAVGVSPNGVPVIFSGSDDGSVRAWRLADGSQAADPLETGAGVLSLATHQAVVIIGGVQGIIAAALHAG